MAPMQTQLVQFLLEHDETYGAYDQVPTLRVQYTPDVVIQNCRA